MQLQALRLVALVAVAIAAFVFYLASLIIYAPPAAAGLTGHWINEGGLTEGIYGDDVHTAGDVNCDGYDDVIIASPGVAGVGGRAFVHHGSAAGISAAPAWTQNGGPRYASHVSTAGDVNGDGYDDVLVGDERWANGEVSEGRVQLFLGGPTGLAATAAWSFEPDIASAKLGPCAFAGDVNADGYDDILMAAPGVNANNGRVYLYQGNAAGQPTHYWTATSGLNESFGRELSTAGDLNADGFDDILIATSGSERMLIGLSFGGGTIALSVLTSPSPVALASFGGAVSTAGDVNGDGYSDFFVGASTDSTGHYREGKVYLYLGDNGGYNPVPAWSFESNVRNATLGRAVAPAGDVNGDGYADALLAAPNFTGDQNYEGIVYAFYGSAAGLDSSPFWVAEGEAGPALFGKSVCTAGDINGDGYADVIGGAPAFEETAEWDEGRVGIWLGGPEMPGTGRHTVDGSQLDAGYGTAVAFGDFDGDGFSDRAFGAPLRDLVVPDQGDVQVYQGGPGTLQTIAHVQVEFRDRDDHFGRALAGGHDINGDGRDELLVGAPNSVNTFGEYVGAAHVYWGDASFFAAGAGVPTTLWGDQEGSDFGFDVACAGDVNGDGYPDAIVGAPLFEDSQPEAGAAYVYLGGPAGISTTPVWTYSSNTKALRFGWSVACVGDINLDGFSDVAVGGPGAPGSGVNGEVYVFFGDVNGISAAAPWIATNAADDEFGWDVAGCDTNGDGAGDLLVGVPGFGGVGMYEIGQIQLFESDGNTLPAAPTLPLDGVNELQRLGETVGGADFDQDGRDEIVGGAPNFGGEGRVEIFQADGTSLWHTNGSSPGGRLGAALAVRGDANGDGFPELLAGAPQFEDTLPGEGAGYSFVGNVGHDVPTPAGLRRRAIQRSEITLHHLGMLGDADVAALRFESDVRSSMGRDDVRLEVELKRVGQVFDGTATFDDGLVNTGAPGSDGSVASESILHAGIAPDERYHWRLRHVSDHPYATSPWFSPAGNGWGEMDFRRLALSTGVTEIGAGTRSQLDFVIAPVPFRSTTTIDFELPADGPVRLAVFDVQGRRVNELVADRLSAGRHRVPWTGNDATGRRVASGVYFAVLETETAREMKRVVLAR